jgi:hypothetical protein
MLSIAGARRWLASGPSQRKVVVYAGGTTPTHTPWRKLFVGSGPRRSLVGADCGMARRRRAALACRSQPSLPMKVWACDR